MALTVKELGDELDSLSAKVDSTADKFTDKLDALSKNQNSTSVAVASLQADAASLKQVIADASLNSLHGDVVSLKTTVANAKLIGVVGTIVVALLGGAGVWQIVQTQFEIKNERARFLTLSDKADKLIVQHALMMKQSLIERIESGLNSEASLDVLKDKPQVYRIQADAKELEALNENLPSSAQSKYYLIGRALTAFLNENCGEVLRILDQLDGPDREYYGFYYMQGACYLRTGKPDLAKQAFTRASKLTSEGKRVQMTLNANGVSNLALWKSLKDIRQHEADEALNDAILQFEYLKKTYPDYAAAYINSACAYAARKDYKRVSEVLGELRTLRSPEAIAQSIQEDVSRPSEAYLTDYVREELKVRRSAADPAWKQEIILGLPAQRFAN